MRRLGMLAGVLALSLAFLPAPAKAEDAIDKLREDLNKLQAELKLLKKEREVDRARIKQLEDDLDRLRGRMSSTSRKQFSFDPSTEMGTVVLRNQLDVPATVTINGVTRVVKARSSVTLSDVPVGAMRYTVTADGFGVGPEKRTTVPSSDPLTITIYDTRRDSDR